MRKLAALIVSCIAGVMIVTGFGVAMGLTVYAGWFGDLDTGAPFNPFAGLVYLAWLARNPLVFLGWAVGFLGFIVGAVASKLAPRNVGSR